MTARRAEINSAQERQPARLQAELAELKNALHRLELLRAARISFERDLARAFNWPADKPLNPNQPQKLDRHGRPTKYNRRPPTAWKGRRGYDFVLAILRVQARGRCTVAAAVRELKEHEPDKWPEAGRDLQRRYQEIKDYWGPWCQVAMRFSAAEEEWLAETEPQK
jgi:hypothetical protein